MAVCIYIEFITLSAFGRAPSIAVSTEGMFLCDLHTYNAQLSPERRWRGLKSQVGERGGGQERGGRDSESQKSVHISLSLSLSLSL